MYLKNGMMSTALLPGVPTSRQHQRAISELHSVLMEEGFPIQRSHRGPACGLILTSWEEKKQWSRFMDGEIKKEQLSKCPKFLSYQVPELGFRSRSSDFKSLY